MSDASGRRQQAWRLASELRRVIEQLARVDPPEEDLAAAGDAAAAFADRLEALLPARWSYEGFAEAALAGSPSGFFDRSPVIGLANPLAAPIHLEVVETERGTRVRGRATFTAAYEGPPGCLHGGFIAASFDDVLGFAQSLSGQVGMTGTLTVRYRSPTPLYEELTFDAGVDGVEGRKIFASGTCHAGERLTAEAEAIFVSVGFGKFAEQIRERERRRGTDADDA